MGISNAGPVGNWRKKVGNVVARISQGRTLLSIYQPSVSNPRTPAQQAQRMKLDMSSQRASTIAGALKVGFRHVVKTGTAYAYAVGLWMKACFTGAYPNFSFDYTKMRVSSGSLLNGSNMACQAAGEDFTLSWVDNSDVGNALATDKCNVIIINEDKIEAISEMETAQRSSHSATVSVSSAWSGDKVSVYAFFQRPDGSLVSDSLYLGTFTV